jgi:hypothetical protein
MPYFIFMVPCIVTINKIQQDATVCRYFLPPTWPRWRKIIAQILWPVPEAAVTVLCTPDDRCNGHPEYVE